MKQQYLKNTAELTLHEDKCTGCGICLEVCPHGVFEMCGSKIKIADKDSCMECSACAQNCPSKALDVRKGVGCAAAVIMGLLSSGEPSCG